MTPEQYLDTVYDFSETDIDGRVIADTLRGLDCSGSWLDLGSGPMLSVWSIFGDKFQEIIGSDICLKNVRFLKAQKRKQRLLAPHLRAAAYHGADQNWDLDDLCELAFGRVRKIVQIDVREFRVDFIEKFDLVSQIGCFGCLSDMEELRLAIQNVEKYLKPGGLFLSVTWTQEEFDGDVVWNGAFSKDLSHSVFSHAIISAKLDIEHELVRQSCDHNWDKQILFLARKTSVDNVVDY